MLKRFSRPVMLAIMLATIAVPAAFAQKPPSEHKKCVTECTKKAAEAKKDCATKKGAEKKKCIKDANDDKAKCVAGCPK